MKCYIRIKTVPPALVYRRNTWEPPRKGYKICLLTITELLFLRIIVMTMVREREKVSIIGMIVMNMSVLGFIASVLVITATILFFPYLEPSNIGKITKIIYER